MITVVWKIIIQYIDINVCCIDFIFNLEYKFFLTKNVS